MSADLGTPPEEGVYQVLVAITDNSVPRPRSRSPARPRRPSPTPRSRPAPAVAPLAEHGRALATNVVGIFDDGNTVRDDRRLHGHDRLGRRHAGDRPPPSSDRDAAACSTSRGRTPTPTAGALHDHHRGQRRRRLDGDPPGHGDRQPTWRSRARAPTITAVGGPVAPARSCSANFRPQHARHGLADFTAVINDWGDGALTPPEPLSVVLTGSDGHRQPLRGARQPYL